MYDISYIMYIIIYIQGAVLVRLRTHRGHRNAVF